LAASRKLEPLGFSRLQATQDIAELQRAWSTILPSWAVLDVATELLDQYNLSFWDSMIVAACLEGGVTRLYSEDFDAYAEINGLKIVNPFKVRS
jgi:predicted nucleic acid-binding protein